MNERDEAIHELSERLRPAEEERNFFRQQAAELKETNEALRRALSMQIRGKVDNTGVLGTSIDMYLAVDRCVLLLTPSLLLARLCYPCNPTRPTSPHTLTAHIQLPIPFPPLPSHALSHPTPRTNLSTPLTHTLLSPTSLSPHTISHTPLTHPTPRPFPLTPLSTPTLSTYRYPPPTIQPR
jgi:hypothetical protein